MDMLIQWIVAAVVSIVLLFVLPFLIVRMKAYARRKAHMRGVGQGLAVGFAPFDPANARALQVIEMRKDVGHADEGSQGDVYGPTPEP
jgi:uncharacterized membrane protein YjgN (DUF898 family)